MDGPRAADYLEALQFPAESFRDPDLAGGAVELSPLGLPRPMSGNVASVFKVTAPDGRAYAVRCFVRHHGALALRYAAVSQRLRKVGGTWKLGVDFQPEGVLVGDHWQPIVKMDWSEATPLLSWVEAHLWDTAALSYVAARFLSVVDELRAAGVAHGDLQHGNVLVAPGGDIRLVDYDGMYVPEMARMRLRSEELGHRNYAHPGRTLDHFGPHLDNFPAWVVYVSLAALSIDPLLWGRLDGGDECLLFRAADFEDPDRSPAFACLAAGDRRLAALGQALRGQVARSVEEVEAPSFAVAPPPALAPAAAAAQRDLLEVLRTSVAPEAVEVEEPEPVEVEAAFGPEIERDRRGVTAALVVLALLPLLGLAGVVPPMAAAGAAAAGLAVGAWLVVRQFHRLSVVQAGQPHLHVLSTRRAAAAAADERVAELALARQAVDAEEQRAAEQFARLEADFRAREQAEVQAVEDELRRVLADVASREQELSRAERSEADDALGALQAQVLDVELANHRLVQAKVADKALYGLALDDIRTAADIAAVEVAGDDVCIVRPDGRRVRTAALGPEDARVLARWRARVAAQYQHLVPTRLPVDRAATIRAAYEDKRAALAAEAAAAKEAAVRRAEEVKAEVAAEQVRRRSELEAAQQAAAVRRLELDRELGRARKDAAEARFRLAEAEREAGHARHLTPAAYIRTLVRR